MTKTVLDHVSIGTRVLSHGWELFGGLLGGTWVYGGDSPGFWWGQVRFGSGPKIELITPTGGPDSAFLERFLARSGPGAHHLNFMVSDIEQTLRQIRALRIEPVQVSLDDPRWKEAFVRSRDASGIVIQVAEQSGPPPELAPPAGLGTTGSPSAFILVEQYVDDIDAALRLYESALDGEVVSRADRGAASVAELTWPNGARLRLSTRLPGQLTRGGPGPLHFSRDSGSFGPAELSRAADLSRLLGVRIEVSS
ncbi:MAG TPA: VOC family protein [Streptosporangiaceae bacterium]|nr:VOC family protein [Streptosporangiaceae bacterium]